jgi:folate-binding protein YgfZ
MFSPDGYRALTEHAAVVRRGDRGVLAVTGADRLTWLQGLLTNDVLALPPGGVCDAAYLTPQGRMITDLRVFNLQDRALLDVPVSLAESLHVRLDGLLFSEEAQITNHSADLQIVEVHGPQASAVVDGLGMTRDDAFDVPGFTAFSPVADVAGVIQTLTNRGAVETTLETLDILRLEAGRPAFLVDMDEHTIPLEAGLEQRAISFSKGCYVGQEVIVRVVHRGGGRVARRLVGLRVDGEAIPAPRTVVRHDARDVGHVTSAAWSPRLACAVALAYVRREFVEPGTTLAVDCDGTPVPVTVSALPIG